MTKQLGLAIAAGIIVAALAYAQSGAQQGAAAKPPPAADGPAKSPVPKDNKKAVAEKPLLLLDDDAEAKPEGMADNSRCHVCHVNFAKEGLAETHARAGIGCAKCHGASDAHIADESWTSGGKGTPPDKMFLPAKVNAFCATCHELGKSDASKCPFPAAHDKKLCTDCHGKHHLAQRKCKWK